MSSGQETWACDLCPFGIRIRWWISRNPFRLNDAITQHITSHHRMGMPEYERLAAAARTTP